MQIIALLVAIVAGPLTFQQCFDRYMRELQRINENEAHGIVNHYQAVSQRVGAWHAYQQCREDAYEAWFKQWWRETMENVMP